MDRQARVWNGRGWHGGWISHGAVTHVEAAKRMMEYFDAEPEDGDVKIQTRCMDNPNVLHDHIGRVKLVHEITPLRGD